MVGTLLLRGMLVGVLAGTLCFGFLKIVGEPTVDRAIAFEAQMDKAKEQAKSEAQMAHGMTVIKEAPEPELVSRSVQAGIGLFTGVVVYSAAFGGLFALAFALIQGRLSSADARMISALLAGAGFIAIYLIPNLKYPASPPSVGEADTIGMRTGLYFAMMAISIAAMIGSAILRKTLLGSQDAWNASLIAAAAYLAIVASAAVILPPINEVPQEFPPVVLWQFRIAALGAQAVMWAIIGLAFGALTARAARREIIAAPRAPL